MKSFGAIAVGRARQATTRGCTIRSSSTPKDQNRKLFMSNTSQIAKVTRSDSAAKHKCWIPRRRPEKSHWRQTHEDCHGATSGRCLSLQDPPKSGSATRPKSQSLYSNESSGVAAIVVIWSWTHIAVAVRHLKRPNAWDADG